MEYTILLVEDEIKISNFVKAYLDKENYKTIIAKDGEEAINLFNIHKDNIHLVVLDLMIPKISGEDVCRKIRQSSNIPIIMLTAKSSEDNKIEGLSIGADDYITKPFSPRELMARIQVLLRRVYSSQVVSTSLAFNQGDLKIYPEKMLVFKKDMPVELTSHEFKILLTLVENQANVLTREQIINLTFGNNYDGYDRTIDAFIKNIRQKIEDDPKKPKYIETVYGAGYRFKA